MWRMQKRGCRCRSKCNMSLSGSRSKFHIMIYVLENDTSRVSFYNTELARSFHHHIITNRLLLCGLKANEHQCIDFSSSRLLYISIIDSDKRRLLRAQLAGKSQLFRSTTSIDDICAAPLHLWRGISLAY